MLPLFILGTAPFAGALRRTNQNKRAAGAAATNAMEESINNVGAVQSLGGAKKEQKRFAERSAQTFLRERYAFAVLVATVSVLSTISGLAALDSKIRFDGRSVAPSHFMAFRYIHL